MGAYYGVFQLESPPGKQVSKSVMSPFTQFSTQKRDPPLSQSLPVIQAVHGILLPLNGLLIGVRKDK